MRYVGFENLTDKEAKVVFDFISFVKSRGDTEIHLNTSIIKIEGKTATLTYV